MIKSCVILNGELINVGIWDQMTDETGKPKNPVPDGATVEEREVIQDADGGWRLASDYEALRRAEYPPIGDQLDALWKGGTAASDMLALVMAVKDKYPKPEV